jgi:putative peptide zinc metalloprotease protein
MAANSQTFSESWYRVANERICLRAGINVRRQNFRGERWIVLENPFSNQYFRIRPEAYEFIARLRPDRTVQEVWKECIDRFPDTAPGQEAALQLLSQLYLTNLLQYDVATDAARLFERYQKNRQRETKARLLSIMFMRFPLLDPDEFLVRTLPFVRKLISPVGALIWLVVVGWAFKLVLDHWPDLKQQTQGVLAPDNLFLLYAGLIFIKTLHEFGHAYFCRKFGGEVHVMGIMLMIFTPIPYMDATSSWGFRSRWQRLLVGSAGMIVEIFVAAVATFVWVNTGPGTINSLAYNMMFIASVSTVLFNINPLLRFDGYYMLSDLLDIPNLHQRSLKHLRYLWEKFVFGLKKVETPALSRREAGWLTSFGILSGIYKIFVFTTILFFVADRFLILGILMVAICFVSWIITPLFRFINYLASSPKLERNRSRAVGVTAMLVASLFVFLQLVPFPNRFRAPGVIQSTQWTQVLTETPGQIEAILATPGAAIEIGQPLVQLANRELELQLAASRAVRDEIQARLRQAMKEDTALLKPLNSRLESASQRVRRLERDYASLTIRARQDGIWVAPYVDDYVGRWMPRGTALGLLLNPAEFEFAATVAQEDGDRLFTKQIQGAEIRLFGEVENILKTTQLKVIPAEQRRLPSAALGWMAGGSLAVASNDPDGLTAAEPFFEVRAALTPNEGFQLLHGHAGRIRFELPAEPLLPRGLRRLRQIIQKRYQL